jgi:hypothetical protein
MVYANEFELEGLVASASGTPGELKEKVVQSQLIRKIVEAYGLVRPNLIQHASGYPTAEQLLDRVKSGNPNRGREAVGEGLYSSAIRFPSSAPGKKGSNVRSWNLGLTARLRATCVTTLERPRFWRRRVSSQASFYAASRACGTRRIG